MNEVHKNLTKKQKQLIQQLIEEFYILNSMKVDDIKINNINESNVPELEQEKENIKSSFSYNKEWYDLIKKLYSSSRKSNSKEFFKLQDLLFSVQRSFDLYPTSPEVAKLIYNDFTTRVDNTVYNILEPSFGLGSLIFNFIDNKKNIKINKIDAIEYSTELYNIVKPNFNISNYYNNDFLEFKQDRPYNLILMNPPYRGRVNDKNEITVYYYHIVKALLLDYANYDKTIYLICPMIHKIKEYNPKSNRNMFEPDIKPTLEKRIAKYFNIDLQQDEYNMSLWGELGNIQFEILGEVQDFKQFNKDGRPSKMGLKTYLYKIIQCCSDKVLQMGDGMKKKNKKNV